MARENLTNKQRAFVEAYLANGFNATQAAITAGYSADSARVIGAQNLAKVNIASHVRARITELAMSADEVLLRLAEHARGDMADVVEAFGATGDWKQAKEKRASRLVKKVKQTIITRDEQQTEIFEYELYDAQAALIQLGRHHGLFTDKTDITSGGLPIKTYISVSPDDWDAADDT